MMKETPFYGLVLPLPVILLCADAFLVGCGTSTTAAKLNQPPPVVKNVYWPQAGFDGTRANFNPREARIHAANVGDLSLLWTKRFSSSIRHCVSVTEDKAYFGLYGGEFFAVDAATGDTIWKVENDRKHSGQAVVGNIVVSSWTNRVSAFDADSGEPLWTHQPAKSSLGGPLVVDDVVYVSNRGREILRFDAASGALSPPVVSTRAIAIADGVAYGISEQFDKLRAFDLETGEIFWEQALERDKRTSSPVVSSGVVIVTADIGKVYAFDASTTGGTAGEILWTGDTKPNAAEGVQTPAVAYGKVFCGMSDTFYCFDLKGAGGMTQQPLWTATTQSPFFSSSSPSVANGVVYTTCGVDEVYGFDVVSGAQAWRYSVVGSGHPMRSSVTIADGRVYVPCTFSFRLMVFHLP